MKTIRNGVIGIFTIVFNLVLHAQVAQMGGVQIQTEDAAFPGLQAVASDALPQSGTWWLASDTNAPPFPVFPPSLAAVTNDVPVPVYQLGPNAFLVDNRQALAVESALSSLESQLGIKAGGPGRVMTMDSGLPSPPDGGGDTNYDSGDGTNSGGYPHTTLLNPPSNSLWLELWLTNQAAQVFLHGTTNGAVYELMSALSISSTGLAWSAEQAMHGIDGQDWVSTVVPMLDRTNTLFLWARDWTTNIDSRTGFPEWWEFEFFGSNGLAQGVDPNGDLDGDQVCNGMEYTNGTDPNKIQFSLAVTNFYVNTASPPVQLNVGNGVPVSMAVLVDSTNFAGASWIPYNATPAVNLGTNEGWHDVWIGLRGYSVNSAQTWQWARFKLDLTAPLLVITNPAPGTTSRPMIQLKGYSLEPLAGLYFDVVNAAGSVTNQQGLTVGQFYDRSAADLTTNWFECLDIGLAQGTNTVTVRATDRAGNLTQTNWAFIFSTNGDTVAPVMTIVWPHDGMKGSGTNFILRGVLDDETAAMTAQIVDTNGLTNAVSVLVERNGKFWAENLPLSAGTNAVSLTATDAAGNSSVTNLNVVQSDVVLSINPVSDDQLHQMTVTVQGSVSDASRVVWVNGVTATVSGNGAWQADGVPINSGGTASFSATAYPANEAPSSFSGNNNPQTPNSVQVEADEDKPPQVYVQHYDLTYNSDVTSYSWLRFEPVNEDYRMEWTNYSGGDSQYDFLFALGWPSNAQPASIDTTWPADAWWPTLDGTQVSMGQGGTNSSTVNPPTIPMEQCAIRGTGYFYNIGDGRIESANYGRTANTIVHLFTGGKEGVERVSLHRLDVTLYANAFNWWFGGGGQSNTVDISEGASAGVFGRVGPGGLVYAALADGKDVVITPEKAGVPNQGGPLPVDTKFQPFIVFGGQPVSNTVPALIVGQPVNLTVALIGPPGSTPPPITNWQWTIPGYAIAGYNPTVNSATIDTNIVTTTNIASFYWVDGGRKQVQCKVKAAGQEFSAETTFNVIRPSVDWIGRVMNNVAVDTNYFYIDGFSSQVWLHFGNSQIGEEGIVPGIYFIHTNLNLNGCSGPNDFFCVQLADATSQHCRTNGTTLHQTGNGLDSVYPCEDFGNNLEGVEFAHDSPATTCSTNEYKVTKSDHFKIFLMFQPETPSIPVPLKLIEWSWSASASANSNQVWSLTSSNVTINVNNQDTSVFPLWTNNVLNWVIVTNSICE